MPKFAIFVVCGKNHINSKKSERQIYPYPGGRGKPQSKHSFPGRTTQENTPNGRMNEREERVSFAACGRKACAPPFAFDFLYIHYPGRKIELTQRTIKRKIDSRRLAWFLFIDWNQTENSRQSANLLLFYSLYDSN